MIEFDIPGRRYYRLEHLALDLNGTLTFDGKIIPGTAERLGKLQSVINIMIVTADTYGKANELGKNLGIPVHKLEPGNEAVQKSDFVRNLGSDKVVSIGNGANDSLMLKESALGICVLGTEGTSAGALSNSDLVAQDISIALDLLINPKRLIATLRE